MKDQFWSIVKGIGIICVVLGHCCPDVRWIAFVYLFHLPLFFFVSGYLYKPEKWLKEGLAKYIGSRLISVWPRFVLYGIFFVLIHNSFVERGLLADALYNHTNMLQTAISYGLFLTADSNAGALWFVAPWLLSCIALGSVFAACERLFPEKLCKPITYAVLLLFSVTGIFLIGRKAGIMYNAQISLAMMYPVLLGVLLRAYLPAFRKYLKPPVSALLFLFSAAVLVFLRKRGIGMDLSTMHVNPYVFWLQIPAGLLLTVAAAGLISALPGLKTIIAFLGNHSFDIMALHFTVFKLIDMVYIKLHPELASSSAGFPTSFSSTLFAAYMLLGLLLPAFAGAGLDRLKMYLTKVTR